MKSSELTWKKNNKNHGVMERWFDDVILNFYKTVMKKKTKGNKNYETSPCLPPKRRTLAYTDCL